MVYKKKYTENEILAVISDVPRTAEFVIRAVNAAGKQHWDI